MVWKILGPDDRVPVFPRIKDQRTDRPFNSVAAGGVTELDDPGIERGFQALIPIPVVKGYCLAQIRVTGTVGLETQNVQVERGL